GNGDGGARERAGAQRHRSDARARTRVRDAAAAAPAPRLAAAVAGAPRGADPGRHRNAGRASAGAGPVSRPRDRRGLALLEVLVGLAVLAIGVTAVQRLFSRSVAAVASDAEAGRAMALARALLAEAEVSPPEPGHTEGQRADGLRYQRDVRRTPHPGLREV